ncbi:LCP family protein [Patescibacteria group bacterium]|nr:LCP family protein [Patescibacteria group bacterium]MBU1683769.1 LCP family protein [Patescibacteria group bacterium]MBU1934752.1 LCP family protein [Patescibacteria group bacterium]
MAFKTRRIRKRPPVKPFKKLKWASTKTYSALKKTNKKQRSYVFGAILVLLGVFVVGKVMFAAYNFVTNFDPKSLIFAVGSELQKDENGYTNIVLLGDGGHVRDGADLIDTIMVASIDYEKNAVTLLSIPRDYYVKDVNWPGKINELYRNHKRQYDTEDELFGLFKTVVGDITNLDIHYYIRVNFNAFVEVVDGLGGITVDVQDDLYDPYYPNETDNGYIIFEMEKGLQEMDGETALKFVRSRKTTSDFDRAARQQLVLQALREKALEENILTKTSTLKKMYDAVSANMNTDMSLREMIALAAFGKSFDRNHLVTKVIHDDPGQDGGFLYTPEREYYNGQFVLIPFGDDLELIHKYCDLIFNYREAFWDPPQIEVLNATKASGIARNTAYQLNRFGFNILSIDNYEDSEGEREYLEESAVLYYSWEKTEDNVITSVHQGTIDALKYFVNTVAMPADKQPFTPDVGISIILGDDYDVYMVN